MSGCFRRYDMHTFQYTMYTILLLTIDQQYRTSNNYISINYLWVFYAHV